MQVFEMVVWVVAITVIGSIVKNYYDHKRSTKSDGPPENSDMKNGYYSKRDLALLLERFDALEERVQILERIATDKGRNLAEEIDKLK